MGVLGSSGLLLEQTGEEVVNAARVVAVRILVRLEVSAIGRPTSAGEETSGLRRASSCPQSSPPGCA
jgi:hypothetical protein